MESMAKILDRLLKDKNVGLTQEQIKSRALKNPQVQEFIKKNKDSLDQRIIDDSINNLYIFSQQVENPNALSHKIIKDYEPHLFLNGKIIDITYAPSANKLAQDKRKKARGRIELIDLPEKLRSVELKDVDQNPGRESALLAIARFLDGYKNNPHTKGLYLTGDFGVGKTYMLAGLANSVAELGRKVIFLHVPSFIASLSRHFKDNSLNDEIDKIANAPVVIFDDIGAETLSEWSRDDVLGVILQKRMDNELPTFFSSNLSMDLLEDHFSETKNAIDQLKARRIMERVRFLGPEIFVDGRNRRY